VASVARTRSPALGVAFPIAYFLPLSLDQSEEVARQRRYLYRVDAYFSMILMTTMPDSAAVVEFMLILGCRFIDAAARLARCQIPGDLTGAAGDAKCMSSYAAATASALVGKRGILVPERTTLLPCQSRVFIFRLCWSTRRALATTGNLGTANVSLTAGISTWRSTSFGRSAPGRGQGSPGLEIERLQHFESFARDSPTPLL